MRQPFVIGGLSVAPGERRVVDLPISKLSNHAPVTLPVHVLHGSQPGPTMFVCAAIHGDELNGVEIIRRLLRTLEPQSISGTLLCVPVVNVYGFISRSRYLPDRRDLNRSFPGSANGSLAARLAHLFMTEIVKRSQIGIDLHTAAIHRVNLPQIRCLFHKRPRVQELGLAFGADVMLESPERRAPARSRPRRRRRCAELRGRGRRCASMNSPSAPASMASPASCCRSGCSSSPKASRCPTASSARP